MSDGPANFRTTAEEPTLPPAKSPAEPVVVIEEVEILVVEVPTPARKKAAAKKGAKKTAKKAAKKTAKTAAKKSAKKAAKKSSKTAAKKSAKKAAKKTSKKK